MGVWAWYQCAALDMAYNGSSRQTACYSARGEVAPCMRLGFASGSTTRTFRNSALARIPISIIICRAMVGSLGSTLRHLRDLCLIRAVLSFALFLSILTSPPTSPSFTTELQHPRHSLIFILFEAMRRSLSWLVSPLILFSCTGAAEEPSLRHPNHRDKIWARTSNHFHSTSDEVITLDSLSSSAPAIRTLDYGRSVEGIPCPLQETPQHSR